MSIHINAEASDFSEVVLLPGDPLRAKHIAENYLTGAREDAFRNAMRLYGRLSALGNDIAATGADFPPTVPQQEVHQVLTDRLSETRRRFDVLMNEEVDTLNDMLRDRRLPVIISQQ